MSAGGGADGHTGSGLHEGCRRSYSWPVLGVNHHASAGLNRASTGVPSERWRRGTEDSGEISLLWRLNGLPGAYKNLPAG